jgi:geranylgeranylglycerol-phosphate geranylgeranyltransferase
LIDSLRALIKLIRWQNCLITILVVIVAILLLPEHPSPAVFVLAALAAAMIAAYGNIFNDLVDLESDRVNHPQRPLPAGKISPSSARFWLFGFLIIGLVMAARINNQCFILAALAAIMLFLYSAYIKSVPFLSNVWVALIAMLTFFYAGYADPGFRFWDFNLVSAGGIFSFWFHLGREIIKDLQDRKGDLAVNVKTLANSCPVIVPRLVVTLAFLIFAVFGILIYFFLKPGIIYVVTFIFGIIVPILVILTLLWRNDSRDGYRVLSAILKLLMPIGLIVLAVARFQVSP